VSLLKRSEKRAWAVEPIASPFPGTSVFGATTGTPSIDSAMQVSAVWACVRLLADTVSMMPLTAYTYRDGVRTPILDPPLLMRPSSDSSMPDWLYQLMVSALLRGNTYGRVVARDQLGYPVQIELASPDTVDMRVDRATGKGAYLFGGVQIPNDEVFHFKAYRFPGYLKGLSPIQYARRAVATDLAVSDFAYGFFRDGAHPSSILSTDQPINQEQALTIKERFLSAVKGREPAILGAGVKYEQIQISPEESQFLATQKYGTAEIARVFGVPPEMIAAEAGNSMTYANVEQRSIDFLTYSVQSWLTRIEAAFRPLLPGAKHARFDTSVLLRTDLETRMKATAIGIASKQLTPDEARAMNDLPPLTDDQKNILSLVPLDVSPGGTAKTVSATTNPEGAQPTEGNTSA
jgi:HK97 family phage portal protein